MNRSKGWLVKLTFDNDFVDCMHELYAKYGEEVFSIQGIANKHMDIVEYSKNFFRKSGGGESVADVSVDDNANVKEKNVTQYNYESNKATMKMNSLFLMYKYVKTYFTQEDAEDALEKVISGEIFINDMTQFHIPYCYAFDLRNLLADGMNFFRGNMRIKPPKRSDTFIALLIQTTAYVSNQIAGAASFPDFFPILDFYHRRELGDDYASQIHKYTSDRSMNELKKLEESDKKDDKKKAAELRSKIMLWKHRKKGITNQFQNFIYSVNFPFRGSQSPFTNLSVMDKGFMKSLFNGYTIPEPGDPTTQHQPDLDSSIELSKIFFDYFNEINLKEGVFTFPVMTLAISLTDKGELIDPKFADWAAGAACGKALPNIFQDKPTSFSSCCRLKNDFSKVGGDGYQNSFGVGGLSIGSHRVAGVNMARLAMLEQEAKKKRKNPDSVLKEQIDCCHKILYAHRKLIEERIEDGYLPLYTYNWISLRRQYSTFGFIGGHEYVTNHGEDMTKKAGVNLLCKTLARVEDMASKWQEEEKESGHIYNIEQIPGESMAVRLSELDRILGYNPRDHYIYSNQYIPLISEASIYDRFKVQGQLDSHTSGGAILHINVNDEKPLSKKQFSSMMETARETKTVYFAVNYAYSECVDGHIASGKHNTCPVCSKEIATQYTRVVGFITPTRSWNKTRRTVEYPERKFYENGALNFES